MPDVIEVEHLHKAHGGTVAGSGPGRRPGLISSVTCAATVISS
jgi:hypothetical protein